MKYIWSFTNCLNSERDAIAPVPQIHPFPGSWHFLLLGIEYEITGVNPMRQSRYSQNMASTVGFQELIMQMQAMLVGLIIFSIMQIEQVFSFYRLSSMCSVNKAKEYEKIEGRWNKIYGWLSNSEPIKSSLSCYFDVLNEEHLIWPSCALEDTEDTDFLEYTGPLIVLRWRGQC